MSQAVIHVESLGKCYRRGVANRAASLSEAAGRFIRAPLAVLRREQHETFWALRDVSLEVREGEVMGLIGRNGAGKTTLLKILSRITKPTAGFAEIRGRVRSLLEVGTGFHGELTGRENTYLSGSILGMSKGEIDRKFDEIVAFAEIDKFIDTPVKRYSSGMYVRLAFAVAAHLEPEILLVDEVLAVGDINFQKKCLGKLDEVARQGRTVVLVTHQVNQIRRLCHRVVWIDGGQVRQIGPTHEVVSAYETSMRSRNTPGTERVDTKSVEGHFVQWEITRPEGSDAHILASMGPVTVKFTIRLNRPIRRGHHGIALFNHEQQLIWAWGSGALKIESGEHNLTHTFEMLPLRPGPYFWQVSLYEDGERLDAWDCLPEMIVATEIHQHSCDQWNGVLNIPARFEIENNNACG